jgi:hypothetical protein
MRCILHRRLEWIQSFGQMQGISELCLDRPTIASKEALKMYFCRREALKRHLLDQSFREHLDRNQGHVVVRSSALFLYVPAGVGLQLVALPAVLVLFQGVLVLLLTAPFLLLTARFQRDPELGIAPDIVHKLVFENGSAQDKLFETRERIEKSHILQFHGYS